MGQVRHSLNKNDNERYLDSVLRSFYNTALMTLFAQTPALQDFYRVEWVGTIDAQVTTGLRYQINLQTIRPQIYKMETLVHHTFGNCMKVPHSVLITQEHLKNSQFNRSMLWASTALDIDIAVGQNLVGPDTEAFAMTDQFSLIGLRHPLLDRYDLGNRQAMDTALATNVDCPDAFIPFVVQNILSQCGVPSAPVPQQQ
jgi:hypothetical protein